MSFVTRPTVRLALMGLCAAALAACASHPKPTPVAEAPPQAPPRPAPAPRAVPPSAPVAQGVLPGSVQDFVVNVGDRVYFDTDQYAIRPDGQPVLSAQASWLNRYPGVQVRIEGNCDERGTREYNLALDARRANAVKEFLVSQGVSTARVETVSYGKERPICTESSESCWAQNRRGVTTLTGGVNS